MIPPPRPRRPTSPSVAAPVALRSRRPGRARRTDIAGVGGSGRRSWSTSRKAGPERDHRKGRRGPSTRSQRRPCLVRHPAGPSILSSLATRMSLHRGGDQRRVRPGRQGIEQRLQFEAEGAAAETDRSSSSTRSGAATGGEIGRGRRAAGPPGRVDRPALRRPAAPGNLTSAARTGGSRHHPRRPEIAAGDRKAALSHRHRPPPPPPGPGRAAPPAGRGRMPSRCWTQREAARRGHGRSGGASGRFNAANGRPAVRVEAEMEAARIPPAHRAAAGR